MAPQCETGRVACPEADRLGAATAELAVAANQPGDTVTGRPQHGNRTLHFLYDHKDTTPLRGSIVKKSVFAAALNCCLISFSGLGFTQSALPQAVTSFTWVYKAEPEPGKRTWSVQPDGSWHERYPSGNVAKVFDITMRGTVDGCAGAVVSMTREKGFEVFIPDLGCKRMVAKFKNSSANWANMGEMHSIETASRVAKSHPSSSRSSISVPLNSAPSASGKLLSEWEGKWLLLRGEFCTTPDKPNDSAFCGNWDWILSLGSDSIRVTGEVPYGETSFKMKGERCNLDGTMSPQQGRSDDVSAIRYSCKLEDGAISFDLMSVLKHQQVILPGVTLEKNTFALRVRLLEGRQCKFVTLDQKGRSTTNFEGNVAHRSNTFDTSGGLKRNISCQVFSDELTARKRYKGRAELQEKGKSRYVPRSGDALGD